MTPLGRRLARLLLLPFVGPEEADAIVEDVRELAQERGRGRSEVYFWIAILGFPLRMAVERVRAAGRRGNPEQRRGGGMDGLRKEVAYAIRGLRRNPGFTTTTALVLAVSMGAAIALASVVRGVLLDPLPFPEPDRLVSVWLSGEDGRRARMTPGNVSDVRTLDGIFRSVSAFQGTAGALTVGDAVVFVRGGSVTPDYFRTLGVEPVLGRTFTEEEGVPGGPPVVVLGAGLWRRQFGSDPQIVGRLVEVDGEPLEVIGVVPSGIYPTTVNVSTEMPFTSADQDMFLPLRFTEALWDLRRPHIVGTVARLRDGVDLGRAAAALEVLTTQVNATNPPNAGEEIILNPLAEEVVGDVRVALLTLLGTVAGAPDRRRQRGSPVRSPGGRPSGGARDPCGTRRTPRTHCPSVAGGERPDRGSCDAGCDPARPGGDRWMRGLVPYQIPRLDEVGLDGVGLMGTIGFGVALAVLLGLVPVLRSSWTRAAVGSRGATAGTGRRRLQGAVVAFQACLGVVVVVGAALLTRSFGRLVAVDPGFDAMAAWVMPIRGVGDRMPDVVERVRELPGVRAAAMTYDHPLERNWGDAFVIEGVPLGDDDARPAGSLRAFGEGYFDAAGLRVLDGRVPDALDLSGDVAHAVVNRALVERYFPDGDALGAVLYVPSAARNFGEDAARFTVLGIVENVRFLGVDRPSEPAFYLPLAWFPVEARTLMVRPEREGLEIVGAVAAAVREVAPGAAIQNTRRLTDIRDDLLARPRFNMMLLVSLAAIGLGLTGLGAYGLVGRSVVSRTREIGIRMALGADRSSVATSVLSGALRPMVLGGVVGLGIAALLVRSMRSLLFEVSPADPISFVASAGFLLGIGILAAVVPAMKAVSVDPVRALREE